jgi:hypothetical protein
LAVSEDLNELKQVLIPRAICDLFAASGVEIFVTPADNIAEEDARETFIAVSASVARAKLDEMKGAC